MASRAANEILNPLNFVNDFSELSQGIVQEVITSTDEEQKKENADLLISNFQKINEHGRRIRNRQTIAGTYYQRFGPSVF